MKKNLLVLFAVILCLAGCKDKNNPDKYSTINTTHILYGKYIRVEVIEFTLSNGTRCVVVVDNGISCNWK